MEKVTKKYSELDQIEKLKISKVLKYNEICINVSECNIVFEGNQMKYLFVGEKIIDL